MSYDPMAHYIRQLEKAAASRHRPELDLIHEAERCATCGASYVLIHYADCPLANRAQRLGTRSPEFYTAAGHAQFEALLAEAAAGESS